MQRFPLTFTVIFSALLCGCGSTGGGSQQNYELYKQTVNEEKMLTASAARYLRRSVLSATSDAIKPGIYTPTEVERLLANSCNDGGTVGAALTALNNNKIDGFEYVPKIGPFGELPRELTYYEMRNRDERRGPDYRTPGTVDNRPQQVPGCLVPAERVACTVPASRAPDGHQTSTVKDLDFVMLISASAAQRCDQLHNATNDLTRSGNHDALTRAYVEENNKRTAELAAATFGAEDMPRLVRLLPGKYHGTPASSAALPPIVQQEVESIFATVFADARKSFKERKVPDAILSFNDSNPSESRGNHLGGWLRRLGPAGADPVYVSPALVRAPLYLCYHSGAFQYVTARYNLISQLMRNGVSAWRSLSREEVLRLAETQLQNEARYKQCLNSQFYFVMSREIPHLIAKDEGRAEIAVEARADCFGFINTRRNTKFDLGIFSVLPATGIAGSPSDLLTKRRNLLDQLNAHFSNAALPPTGEETLQFCGKWADERATLATQAGN